MDPRPTRTRATPRARAHLPPRPKAPALVFLASQDPFSMDPCIVDRSIRASQIVCLTPGNRYGLSTERRWPFYRWASSPRWLTVPGCKRPASKQTGRAPPGSSAEHVNTRSSCMETATTGPVSTLSAGVPGSRRTPCSRHRRGAIPPRSPPLPAGRGVVGAEGARRAFPQPPGSPSRRFRSARFTRSSGEVSAKSPPAPHGEPAV